MKSVITVLKEQINHFYLIRRLSVYEVRSANNNNYLGNLWEILNPMIQISIYWFVFGYGIRGGEDVDGIPYLPWMLAGITVWFFVNQGILQGSRSIYSRIKIISKMSFPMSVIPSYVIFSKFYQHLMLFGIIAVILHLYGFTLSLHYVQIPYFMFATLSFLFAFSLITSTLSTIVRDVQLLLASVMRVLLYLTPILWTPDKLPEFVQQVMKVNPVYYIVEGYRSAFLGTSWYAVENFGYTLYFWALVLVLLLFGSMLHLKFRDRFVDFL